MSDSEDVFDLDVSGSESDGFVPTKKKAAKAPAKKTAKAAPRAAAKPKPTKKTKVLVDKDDNADTEDDNQDDDPASAAGPSTSSSIPKEPAGKKKTASEMYTKVRSPVFDASMRVVTAVCSSRNWNTSSSDRIPILEAWRRLSRTCGPGTLRISVWSSGRSSTFRVSSRL